MRISDWSSDVCSSDLRARIGFVQPVGNGGPALVVRHGHRARHPVRGCVPDLRLCRGGAPDRQHHHRGTRPPWRRSVSPGGRVMRFRRWPRPTAYRETSRKRAAFLRKQRLEREALPLFAAQRSEEHTSELQSLMRISYAVFCLKKKKNNTEKQITISL